MGADWPLTVRAGKLSCDSGAVYFRPRGGPTYAVNGTALTRGAPRINPIWKKTMGELRNDIGPLIDRGLALC